MDPFLAVQKIRRAMSDRWGSSMELPDAGNWRGKYYLPWKLRQIHYPIPHTEDLEPLTLRIDGLGSKRVYVSAATWYGEESPLAAVQVPALEG